MSRSLTMNLAGRTIKSHIQEKHNCVATREIILVNSAKIITHNKRIPNNSSIYEALPIQKYKPLINQQITETARSLKLLHDIQGVDKIMETPDFVIIIICNI